MCIQVSLCLYCDLYVFTMISMCLLWSLCVYYDLYVFSMISMCFLWSLCVYYDLYVYKMISLVTAQLREAKWLTSSVSFPLLPSSLSRNWCMWIKSPRRPSFLYSNSQKCVTYFWFFHLFLIFFTYFWFFSYFLFFSPIFYFFHLFFIFFYYFLIFYYFWFFYYFCFPLKWMNNFDRKTIYIAFATESWNMYQDPVTSRFPL